MEHHHHHDHPVVGVMTSTEGVMNSATPTTYHHKDFNIEDSMRSQTDPIHDPAADSLIAASGSFRHDHHRSDLSGGNGMAHMRPFFHFDIDDVILFEKWVPSEAWQMILSCLFFFILAALYEALKMFREELFQTSLRPIRSFFSVTTSHTQTNGQYIPAPNGNEHVSPQPVGSQNSPTASAGQVGDCGGLVAESGGQHQTVESRLPPLEIQRHCRLFSRMNTIQTFLHMLQVAISYILMLVFMTFNTYLCVAVILGAGLGYFLFGSRRSRAVMENMDHCN